MNDQTLQAFLFWTLTGPGVATVLSVASQLPYAQAILDKLDYDGKRLLFMALSLAVPLLATWGAVSLDYLPGGPDTAFKALAAGWAGFMASQATHLMVRKA
jgi:hypothetical protein